MDAHDPPRAATDEVRLAEFAALRNEIAQRSLFQHGLIVLNLTAIGAIVGLVFGRNADHSLLLLLPILSPALGLLWFGNHVAIIRIGSYIGAELWVWEPSWELWLTRVEPTHGGWWNHTWWPVIQLIFCGAPAVALSVTVPFERHSPAIWGAMWATGAALTAYLAVASSLLRRLPRAGADGPR